MSADLSTDDLGMLNEACHHAIELLEWKIEDGENYYDSEDIDSMRREIEQYQLLAQHVGRLWLAAKDGAA